MFAINWYLPQLPHTVLLVRFCVEPETSNYYVRLFQIVKLNKVYP